MGACLLFALKPLYVTVDQSVPNLGTNVHSHHLFGGRPENDDADAGLDSNDEDFAQFERGGGQNFLGQIPEGSAEAIALCLLGMKCIINDLKTRENSVVRFPRQCEVAVSRKYKYGIQRLFANSFLNLNAFPPIDTVIPCFDRAQQILYTVLRAKNYIKLVSNILKKRKILPIFVLLGGFRCS